MLFRLTLLLPCLILLPGEVLGSSIYKCMNGDKIIFSQSACPDDFKQHEIEYELGITTETDSDQRTQPKDYLKELLSNQTMPSDKLLRLLDAEIYRLQQENSYFRILQASEMKKLERKRYWQKKAQDDPWYLKEKSEVEAHFSRLTELNINTISLLEEHKSQLTESSSPPETELN